MSRNTLREARTKIVATVGPACEDEKILAELVTQGVDVFRINAAHGKQEDFARILSKIRSVREQVGFPVAVLLDLAGPKIRLGQLVQDPLEVDVGQELTFIRGNQANEAHELTSNYTKLIDEVGVGDRVMLADGTISMQVTEKTKDSLRCVVNVRDDPIASRNQFARSIVIRLLDASRRCRECVVGRTQRYRLYQLVVRKVCTGRSVVKEPAGIDGFKFDGDCKN